MGIKSGDKVRRPLAHLAEVKDSLPEPAVSAEVRFQKEQARQKIAYVVVGAYIFLVLLNLILPFIIFFSTWPPKESMTIADVKDLMQAISGVLSGFVSILGFIIGYYFKASEEAVAEQKRLLEESRQASLEEEDLA